MFSSFKVSADVIFSTISYTKILCTRRTKGKPLSLARFCNTIIFCSPSFVESNKVLLLFCFRWFIVFGRHYAFLKIEERVKIHGAINIYTYIWRVKLRRTLATLFHDYGIAGSVFTQKIAKISTETVSAHF